MTAVQPASGNLALPEVNRQWAVVCTGFVSADYEVTPIMDGKGNRSPVLIRLFPDRATADKMLKRLQAKAAKVSEYSNPDWSATLPIYGITETDLPSKAKRQKPTNNGTGTPAPAGTTPGRKRRS